MHSDLPFVLGGSPGGRVLREGGGEAGGEGV